ncbi:hypothetical protein [Burkholderia phage FLC9]|nr:hypothetical protein [Burkholderia phage FLC9]
MQNEKRTPNPNRNLPREFGTPIRREAFKPTESFEDFMEDLYQHVWAHTTNNYGDFIQQTKAEDRLFSRAMSQALRGLDTFRRVKEDSIRSLISTAVDQAIRNERDKTQEKIQKLKADYEAIMTPEQKELMAFRARLESHNWWYDYSDDGAVWRNANERHKALLQEAKDKGKPFQDMWLTVYKERIGTQANTTWTFDEFARHNGIK